MKLLLLYVVFLVLISSVSAFSVHYERDIAPDQLLKVQNIVSAIKECRPYGLKSISFYGEKTIYANNMPGGFTKKGRIRIYRVNYVDEWRLWLLSGHEINHAQKFYGNVVHQGITDTEWNTIRCRGMMDYEVLK